MSEASGPTNDPAQLFLANQRLVPFIVNRYFRPHTEQFRDEMGQEGRIALWNACRSYDPSKGAFGAYAGTAIRHRIVGWLMATKGERTLAMLSKPLDEPLLDDGDLTLQDVIPSDEDVTAQAEDREILQKVMNPRAKRFRALRLVLLGLSKKAIERRLGLTWFTLSQRLQEEYRDLMEGTSRRKKKTNKRSKKRASSGTATKLQRGRKILEFHETNRKADGTKSDTSSNNDTNGHRLER